MKALRWRRSSNNLEAELEKQLEELKEVNREMRRRALQLVLQARSVEHENQESDRSDGGPNA